MARDNGGGFWTGFILGAFIGAAAALLFAPAPGEETRERLRERGIELGERAEELSEELSRKGREAVEEQRERLQRAIEEGRVAAEETREKLRSKLEAQKEGLEA
ncbi:MAG: YtxH domain-containing protein [Chloroflexota bacterium]|nr:YtxH domain-containing protein [Chloroflexota bacterium]